MILSYHKKNQSFFLLLASLCIIQPKIHAATPSFQQGNEQKSGSSNDSNDSNDSLPSNILQKDIRTAIIKGSTLQLEKILEENPDMDLSLADGQGQTPLHIACFFGNVDIAKMLVQKKVDTTLQDRTKAGFAPIHWTAFYGFFRITALLITANTSINAKVEKQDSIYYGKRAIDIAVDRGYLKVVEVLVNAGANIGKSDEADEAPLSVAMKKKYSYIERLLREENSEEKIDTHTLVPTPCLYAHSYIMRTPKQRRRLFADLGLIYTRTNKFSESCKKLANLDLSPWHYNRELSNRYERYIQNKYVVPCSLRWVRDSVGYGFFSECDLKEYDYIMEFTGNIIESKKLAKKSWSWGYQKENVIFPHDTCVDSTLYGNEARFINHGEPPYSNTRTRMVYCGKSWHLIYIAIKPIKKGEQFLINYGKGYWSKRKHGPESLMSK